MPGGTVIAAVVVGLIASSLLAGQALGAECLGVSVPDSTKVGNADLVLNGVGIRKATLLKVKVYVAALYLPEKSGDASQILGTEAPWKLVLHFLRDVEAGDIRDAFKEGFETTAGSKLATLQPRIEALNVAMVDFEKGHNLVFASDPQTGVSVDVVGAGGPEIEGSDFSTALLSIWIGAAPPNEGLKSGLLGGKCE